VDQRKPGFDQLDERAAWFYEAVAVSKAMLTETPGVGQRYIAAYKDRDGNWLSGGNTYRLRVPCNPPAKQFWSVTAYDESTRQMVVTEQGRPDLSSRKQDLVKNADGSVDVYFGPKAPQGKEANWVQTVPGKGWFTYFRTRPPRPPDRAGEYAARPAGEPGHGEPRPPIARAGGSDGRSRAAGCVTLATALANERQGTRCNW
jgi:hypothetical protein